MNITDLKGVIGYICRTMEDSKDYLTQLDQQNGDGDLGISMANGYRAVVEYLKTSSESDLGKVLMKCSTVFNETAPSTLGTIISLGFMGMAKVLKGKIEANLHEIAEAMESSIKMIMDKANSKPGDKTILDSIFPAIAALKEHIGEDTENAFKYAAEASREGSENTRNMRSVHGRAAYYGDKSIGMIDGGSVVGKIIFESIYKYIQGKKE